MFKFVTFDYKMVMFHYNDNNKLLPCVSYNCDYFYERKYRYLHFSFSNEWKIWNTSDVLSQNKSIFYTNILSYYGHIIFAIKSLTIDVSFKMLPIIFMLNMQIYNAWLHFKEHILLHLKILQSFWSGVTQVLKAIRTICTK